MNVFEMFKINIFFLLLNTAISEKTIAHNNRENFRFIINVFLVKNNNTYKKKEIIVLNVYRMYINKLSIQTSVANRLFCTF